MLSSCFIRFVFYCFSITYEITFPLEANYKRRIFAGFLDVFGKYARKNLIECWAGSLKFATIAEIAVFHFLFHIGPNVPLGMGKKLGIFKGKCIFEETVHFRFCLKVFCFRKRSFFRWGTVKVRVTKAAESLQRELASYAFLHYIDEKFCRCAHKDRFLIFIDGMCCFQLRSHRCRSTILVPRRNDEVASKWRWCAPAHSHYWSFR